MKTSEVDNELHFTILLWPLPLHLLRQSKQRLVQCDNRSLAKVEMLHCFPDHTLECLIIATAWALSRKRAGLRDKWTDLLICPACLRGMLPMMYSLQHFLIGLVGCALAIHVFHHACFLNPLLLLLKHVTLVGGNGVLQAQALPMLHALTGCDTVSCFAGHGKRSAWAMWTALPALTHPR
jgi:hypothetical protein